jgi:hypothetical protein
LRRIGAEGLVRIVIVGQDDVVLLLEPFEFEMPIERISGPLSGMRSRDRAHGVASE